jgi:hypothetical protein
MSRARKKRLILTSEQLFLIIQFVGDENIVRLILFCSARRTSSSSAVALLTISQASSLS